MRRQIGTALSVIGLLAIGTAAAALNVRVLQGSGSTGALVMHPAGDMTLMDATPTTASQVVASTASPVASAEASATAEPTPSAASASATAKASVEATASPSASSRSTASSSQNGLAPIGSVGAGTSSDDDVHERGTKGEGQLPPQLSPAQMDLLRVSAMAHIPPELVVAVAKGDAAVPAEVTAVVQKVADYTGVDLQSLANVTDIPRLRDRGHGGPNDKGGTNVDS